MMICKYKTEIYNFDPTSEDSTSLNKYKVTFCPSAPQIVDSTLPPKDMEAAWEELSEQDHESTTESSNEHATKDEVLSANRELSSNIESSRHIDGVCGLNG